MGNFFDDDTYNNLLAIMSELGEEYAADFASYFTLVNGYYFVNNLSDYTAWLSDTFFDGGTPDPDWLNWSGTETITSTQGGGVQ